MPIKSVKPDVAAAINNLTAILKQEYGCDYAYSILGNGCVLAQSNINGVVHPVPIVEPSKSKKKKTKKEIHRSIVTTKHGNTLELCYNPENSLVVVNLIYKGEMGRIELIRQVISEKSLLSHCIVT